MILRPGEYRLEDNGIWVSRTTLEEWRVHYNKVAEEHKKEWIKDQQKTFKFPFYLGKADVITDLIKVLE